MQAAFDIIEEQGYHSWKLPPNTIVLLSENPQDGEYIVNSTDEAMRTRFATVDVKYSKEMWMKWASENHIDGRCQNFMYKYPEAVTGTDDNTLKGVNPRMWTKFFRSIANIKNYSDKESLKEITKKGQLYVGSHVNTFVKFIHNGLDKLVDPKFMITEESSTKVLDALINSVYDDNNHFRADISAMLAIRLKHYLGGFAKENTVTNEILDRVELLLTYKEKQIFQADSIYNIILSLNDINKFVKLIQRKEIYKIFTEEIVD